MRFRISAAFFIVAFFSLAIPAQEQEADAAKAAALIREAVRARGGDAYLGIRSLIGKGQYTPFVKGAPDLPQGFIDYIIYPDRERTERGTVVFRRSELSYSTLLPKLLRTEKA